MAFKNRETAGKTLAHVLLREWHGRDPVVVALPRGGLPVAYPVAKAFSAPLDILSTKKIGMPGNPEYAIGAITEDGKVWIDPETLAWAAPDSRALRAAIGKSTEEIKRQSSLFRRSHASYDVRGRDVILVDDGLATGATAIAAIESLKSRGARHIALAVPVASEEGARQLAPLVDQVITVYRPTEFGAVGFWYSDFSQVSDDTVESLLGQGQPRRPEGEGVRRP